MEKEGRTIKAAINAGVGIAGAVGKGAAGLLDLTADTVDVLSQKADESVAFVGDVTIGTSDTILELLDLKIEFILCNIFRVCDKRGDDETVASIFSSSSSSFEDINARILDLFTDEPIIGQGRLFTVYQDQRAYMMKKIKELLCKYKSEQFCEESEAESTPRARFVPIESEGDEEKATLTANLVIRKFFSHLSVKLGFLLCKLRVWCPDEDLAFQ